MGTHHGGNGDELPPEGERVPDPELPELPPEWGQISIPDDPSALADETEQIQAELAEERRTGRRAKPSEPPTPQPRAPVGTPLLIMSMAVTVTLVSLFAMMLTGTNRTPSGQATGSGPAVLPPITLIDQVGRQVALTGQVPMVLLLVEECQCQSLIAATAAAAPSGVRVVTVGHTPPPPATGLAPGEVQPVRLGDPGGIARARLQLAPPGDAATVLLVDGQGQIRHLLPSATSVAQFQGDLNNITG